MTNSVWEFQKAVYARLTGDTTLMAMASGGVHEMVPAEQNFPYIVLTIDDVSDLSTKTSAGIQVSLAVHAFSGALGSKQSSDILDRVYALLHLSNFSVTGATLIQLRMADYRVNTARNVNYVHSTALYHAQLELA